MTAPRRQKTRERFHSLRRSPHSPAILRPWSAPVVLRCQEDRHGCHCDAHRTSLGCAHARRSAEQGSVGPYDGPSFPELRQTARCGRSEEKARARPVGGATCGCRPRGHLGRPHGDWRAGRVRVPGRVASRVGNRTGTHHSRARQSRSLHHARRMVDGARRSPGGVQTHERAGAGPRRRGRGGTVSPHRRRAAPATDSLGGVDG